MKKLICAMLALAVVLMAVACAGEDAGSDTANTSAVTEPEETAALVDKYGRELVASAIPDGLDLEGKTVTIFIREAATIFDTTGEFMAEAQNGEPVNDAVWARERETEEELNVNVEISVSPGADSNVYITSVRKSFLAGDGAYDICAAYAYFAVTMAGEGLMYNLLELPHLDLSKPWWNQNFVDEMTLLDQLYFISGDLSLTATQCTNAMFFNKQMLRDYFGDLNLYDKVNSGEWTIDYFGELVSGVYSDLNGNSKHDDEDIYGVGMHPVSIPVDAFMDAFDLAITVKDDEGLPELAYGTERTVSAFDKLYALTFENEGSLYGSATLETYYFMQDKFRDSENMFLIDIFIVTEKLREMEADYGVLPIFKYNEEQSGYYTNTADVYSLLSVCAGTKDAEATGAVFELMGQKSYEEVTPAYFEIALKQKYIRDNIDAQMYDMILAGCRYNFGFVYSVSLNNQIHTWRALLINKSKDFMSQYAKTEEASKALLDKLIENYRELGAAQ